MTSLYPQNRDSRIISPSAKSFTPESRHSFDGSILATRSNTPDSLENSPYDSENDRECYQPTYISRGNSNEEYYGNSYEAPETSNFEIDVCPKKKKFNSIEEKRQFVEEYKRKYKTELCKNWELRGTCKFGDKCCFAHGKHELKTRSVTHTKFKTKPCKQYFQVGYCPYGQRCQYLHKEALMPNIFYRTSETFDVNFSEIYESLHEVNRLCGTDAPLNQVLSKLPQRTRLSAFKVANGEV